MRAEPSPSSSPRAAFSPVSPDHAHTHHPHRRIPLSLPPADHYRCRTMDRPGGDSGTASAYKNSVRRLIGRRDSALTPDEPPLPVCPADGNSDGADALSEVRSEPRKTIGEMAPAKPRELKPYNFEDSSNLESYYATFLEEISAFKEANKKNAANGPVLKSGRCRTQDVENETGDRLRDGDFPGTAKGKATRLYEAVSECSNDADSINSFKSDNSARRADGQPPHYVDMGRPRKESAARSGLVERPKESPARRERNTGPQKDDSDRVRSGRRSDRIVRRHTTEYRGPPHLALPLVKNDSSDSPEHSPAPDRNFADPYPYSALNERRGFKKQRAAEETGDAVTAALQLEMQGEEWRENRTPKRIESLTVDRRSTDRKNSKSARIKRRGSFNVDPSGEFHLSLDVDRERDVSRSARSCAAAKSPLMDSRKTALQISAEDMVQIANCGARNKNGSLCHFISADDRAYLSVSQAPLEPSSGGEANRPDVPPGRRRSAERNSRKKSAPSLALESSEETLVRPPPPEYVDRAKTESADRRHGGPSRQRSHDLEKSFNSLKHKQEPNSGRKSAPTKSDGPRGGRRGPAGYFLLEDENGGAPPLRLPETSQWKEDIKYQSPSIEMPDKLLRNNHSVGDGAPKDPKEACKCVSSIETDPVVPVAAVFRRAGASSRDNLSDKVGDVEECFDF